MIADKLERKHILKTVIQGPIYDEGQKKFMWIVDVEMIVGDDKKSSSYYMEASIPFSEAVKQIPVLLEHLIK